MDSSARGHMVSGDAETGGQAAVVTHHINRAFSSDRVSDNAGFQGGILREGGTESQGWKGHLSIFGPIFHRGSKSPFRCLYESEVLLSIN